MKQCFKCKQSKPLDAFYKHPQMADGRVNKCIECNKIDVRANRASKVDYYREYDQTRGSRGTSADNVYNRTYFPKKYRARNALNNAVKNGKLVAGPCEECGQVGGVHGHHDDYAQPLNVRWLCPIHHRAWHDQHGEGLNGS